KTALARHVAQVAVGRGWFSGGAVWVDLRGYAADPGDRIAPGQVFGPLLRALGVPAEQIPPQLGEQAAAYHHHLGLLAGAGRALVVLDNASGVDQAAGLMPRHSVHRVMVTSRHTLGELDGARIVDLDVLDTPEAVELVDRALSERDPADRRAAADPAGVAGLVEVCGRLPLALRIAAALLADDAGMAVTGLVAELADATTRVDALAYGSTGVAAAFDLSRRHLTERDPAAAGLFALLPVNPGPDISIEAAAVLADLPVGRVRSLSRVLRQAHLVQPGTGSDRWSMHDLVRAYATGLPEDHPGDRATATDRLLDHYTTTADAADDHLRALPGQPVPDRFTDRDHALTWLDAERANLTAAVTLAANGNHHRAFTLANALAEFLSWRRYLGEWVTVATTAREAAGHLDSPTLEAIAWNNLGLALRQVRRFDEAIDAHQRDLEICRQTGDQHGEGMAWTNLGNALVEVRRFDEAIIAQQTARDLYHQTGDRHGEGMAWANLGLALREVRRFDEAIDAVEQAVAAFAETGAAGDAERARRMLQGIRDAAGRPDPQDGSRP
ncbi:MAG TPA: tetratricopeptide repeat protein, partial [Mycobacteriales bacterium]|nr:tetratricopeptide repeat protein [Mycobacteriales bacterium]